MHKKQELKSISETLRSQFQDFSKYIESTYRHTDKSVPTLVRPSSLTKTYQPSQSTRLINNNFRTRHFVQVSEIPANLFSKAQIFKNDSSKDYFSKSSRQRAVTKSLYEGSKPNKLKEYADGRGEFINSSLKTEDSSAQKLEDFVKSLFLLSELSFDIKITYDIAHCIENDFKEINQIGLFLTIEEELQQILEKNYAENFETAEFEVLRNVEKCMGFVREIIRCLKKSQMDDHAVLIEMV